MSLTARVMNVLEFKFGAAWFDMKFVVRHKVLATDTIDE